MRSGKEGQESEAPVWLLKSVKEFGGYDGAFKCKTKTKSFYLKCTYAEGGRGASEREGTVQAFR